MTLRFQNPANGYIEELNNPGLYCFLFGPLYFVSKGVWTHAIISTVACILTLGFSLFLYPFWTAQIMKKHFLQKGWTEV